MPRPVDSAPRGAQVNVLKKVRTDKGWRLCPVVREANGRLRDRVRVNGHIEVHPEGVYYIEWRKDGCRLREAVPNPAAVLERARLKSLELEAGRAGASLDMAWASDSCRSSRPPNGEGSGVVMVAAPPSDTNSEHLLLAGIEAYVKERVDAALRARFSTVGVTEREPALKSPPHLKLLATPASQEDHEQNRSEQAPSRRLPNGSDTSPGNEMTIAAAIEAYLKDLEPPQREAKTYQKYRATLHRFRETCKKVYVKDIDRNDCLEFMRCLYANGNEARTVYNLISIVQQWLRLHGITGLLRGRDKPRFIANIRNMYQPEDLESLFRACNPGERMRYLFFLLTGERDQEVRHTTWSDIDFTRKCVRVTARRQLGFKPKDKEEREIPVAASLLDALREYKARQIGVNRYDLVFPTSEGRPDKKFENKLKKVAYKAGLNCGHCVSRHGNKCSDGPYCSKWFLHKFRHTFATTSLEEGVSIRTLQEWLGHSDLASTMVYLKYVGRQSMHAIIDKGAMAELAASSLKSLPTSNSALPS
jgi:integrase